MSAKWKMKCPKEWTCEDIGHPEIVSVYGVLKRIGDSWIVGEKMMRAMMDSDDLGTISRSEPDENGDSVDWSCCDFRLINVADEERAVRLLNRSGIGYELFYALGEYLLVKDYYNMSERGVGTEIGVAETFDEDNCEDEDEE